MAEYSIADLEPAQVLAELHNRAFVNGYLANGQAATDDLRSHRLPLAEARKILASPELVPARSEAVRAGEAVEITSINGRWLYLRFEAQRLVALHQNVGDAEGPELYSEHFGVAVQEILEELRAAGTSRSGADTQLQ